MTARGNETISGFHVRLFPANLAARERCGTLRDIGLVHVAIMQVGLTQVGLTQVGLTQRRGRVVPS